MTLEFALRPRFSLDQPAPRRRRRGLRLPALALPVAAYWLFMAGGTHVLLGALAEDAPVSAAPAAEPAPRMESPSVDPVSSPLPSLVPQVSDAPPSLAPRVSDAPPSADVRPTATAYSLPATVAPAFATATARAPVAARAPEASPDFTPAPPRIMEPDAPEPRKREVAEAPVRAPAADEPRSVLLPSCESAAASANQSIVLGAGRGAPDLTRDAFAAVLENGAYLASCAIPARTALEICAAVQDGNVVGVSVTSTPRDPAVAACVRRAVAGLRFPRNASLDVTRTRFEAAH